MPLIKNLIFPAIVVATIIIGGCVFVLTFPNSELACIIERFQTLFTGAVAGLSALITAGIVYLAAVIPDRGRKKAEEINRANLRIATGSFLLGKFFEIQTRVNMASVLFEKRGYVPGLHCELGADTVTFDEIQSLPAQCSARVGMAISSVKLLTTNLTILDNVGDKENLIDDDKKPINVLFDEATQRVKESIEELERVIADGCVELAG